jgi:hypothetical protein
LLLPAPDFGAPMAAQVKTAAQIRNTNGVNLTPSFREPQDVRLLPASETRRSRSYERAVSAEPVARPQFGATKPITAKSRSKLRYTINLLL